MTKTTLGKVEGQIALWLPFAIPTGLIIWFSLSSWGIGGILLVVLLFLVALFNAKILLFKEKPNA
jgi:hypothetical protein